MGAGPRYPRRLMAPEAERLVEILGEDDVIPCGSYRRGSPTMGDIDLVAVADDVVPRLLANGLRVVSPGDPRTEMEMDVSWVPRPVKVDVWRPVPGALGACILHATGSGMHNVLMRRLAISRGLTFSWAGVQRTADGLFIAGLTEESCCEAIGWPCKPPEQRDDVLSWALPLMEGIEAS